MAGLVPAIHVFLSEAPKKDVDARVKPAHDGGEACSHTLTKSGEAQAMTTEKVP